MVLEMRLTVSWQTMPCDNETLRRLLTYSLRSEGYLNVDGDEFGYSKWLDFP
ncbi:hypothetical protein EV421DRAFT_133789 [Armillaria borealis]|uniref:Uncharacterized protein n=1 Tax=Armillaria borealis TaxID=47425 RepID=A0AA39IXW7_9AGAR|nr:hypothetical protein EV421DRAFT_133789 [Armillaria borealis]